MEQAQTTPATAPVSSTNAKSIWSIVAYLSWVGALVAAFKKRDAFHMWHARTSLGVSLLYFVVYALVRVLFAIMPTAGFLVLLAMLVNLFGLTMFVLTIVAMLKAWKGEQWSFFGLAKFSQKIALEKLFPADDSSSPVVSAVETAVQPEVAPAAEVAVEAAPVEAQAPAVVPTPAPVAEPVQTPEHIAPVVAQEAIATPEVAPVEVEVQQEPAAPAVDLGITIEPAAPEVPSVPEVPAQLEPTVVTENNPTPPTV